MNEELQNYSPYPQVTAPQIYERHLWYFRMYDETL